MILNPFYQIYEGDGIGRSCPLLYEYGWKNNFLPDPDSTSDPVWWRCRLCYVCSPGNLSGAVFPGDLWLRLLELAGRYDFVIATDELYSEIYADEARSPISLTQVCAESGHDDFSRCVVFHSLSKRSNLPSLCSGFVAGDAAILDSFLLYRTYHGLHHAAACSIGQHRCLE